MRVAWEIARGRLVVWAMVVAMFGGLAIRLAMADGSSSGLQFREANLPGTAATPLAQPSTTLPQTAVTRLPTTDNQPQHHARRPSRFLRGVDGRLVRRRAASRTSGDTHLALQLREQLAQVATHDPVLDFEEELRVAERENARAKRAEAWSRPEHGVIREVSFSVTRLPSVELEGESTSMIEVAQDTIVLPAGPTEHAAQKTDITTEPLSDSIYSAVDQSTSVDGDGIVRIAPAPPKFDPAAESVRTEGAAPGITRLGEDKHPELQFSNQPIQIELSGADGGSMLVATRETSGSATAVVIEDNPPVTPELRIPKLEELQIRVPTGQTTPPVVAIAPNSNSIKHHPGTTRAYPGEIPSNAEMVVMWEAPAVCHQPLYFEEPNTERHGYRVPGFQPVVSMAHFFGRVPLLPYLAVSQKHRECTYTLGHYRPGGYAPHYWQFPNPHLKGGVLATGVAVGAILAVP